MSSIFQSSYDDSSSGSIESYENEVSNASANGNPGLTKSIPRGSPQTPMALARLSASHPQLPTIQPHQHSTLFYLSLIEGRCRTQAASVLNAGRRLEDHLPEHNPEVHSLAQHLFGEMTTELHKAGVLPDDFAGHELGELRRNYLSSFDSILTNIAARKTHEFQDNNTYSSLFDRSNAYALGDELISNSFTNESAFALQKYTMAPNALEMLPNFPALSLRDPIYKKGYQEICLLGKGGFGKVYKAINYLDKRPYAIKKIVMRENTLVGSSAKDKADEFLSELRALARLIHPNIVRYHHSWAETRPAMLPGDSSSSQSEDDEEDNYDGGIEEDATKAAEQGDESAAPSPPGPTGPIFRDTNDLYLTREFNKESRHVRRVSRQSQSQDGIVFEYSPSSTNSTGGFRGSKQSKANKALVKGTSFFRSGAPEDSDSEDGTEEVLRIQKPGRSSLPGVDIVLYIQMALHPMNLDDYLWPEQQKQDGIPEIEHCYHTIPSARLLLGVLDGVEYIHRNNIVHRDLKPSNIMLSISDNAAFLLDGYLNVSDCAKCQKKPKSKELYLIPHIGDFGLVADIKDTESELSPTLMPNTALIPTAEDTSFQPPALSGLSSRQPGTRFYCAPRSLKGKTIICPKVDVYSFGVIAFEMVYKFTTRSERAVELEKLKDGILPPGFETHEMAQGIKHMLCNERKDRWGCAEVRKWLKDLMEKAQVDISSEKS